MNKMITAGIILLNVFTSSDLYAVSSRDNVVVMIKVEPALKLNIDEKSRDVILPQGTASMKPPSNGTNEGYPSAVPIYTVTE